jgi:predicted anti-sigma-YlaC factor YlaD
VACREFEERLLSYRELDVPDQQIVDVHLAKCGDCRRFFTALGEVDRELTQRWRGLGPSAGFEASVMAASRRMRRLKPPSVVPLVLDFAAAAAMVVVGVALLENAGVVFGAGVLW